MKGKHSFQEGVDKLKAASVVAEVGRSVLEAVASAVEEEKHRKGGRLYRKYLYGDRKRAIIRTSRT